ncbi:hypothetical protein Tco_0930613 [Tanacetum coccineum]
MAADNGFVNLEQLRLLANSYLLKDQLLIYFDLKTQREVQLATEINNLMRQLLDIIDERHSFIGELEQRLSTNEEGLDIDDFDLLLTPIIHPTNNTHIVPEITTTQNLFSSQNNQVDNCVVKPIRIIPGPAGIVQMAKLCKLVDTREGGEESVMSTQYAIDYVNVDGWIMTGYFGDVKKFLKNGKLEQIVAVIKSCTPNLGYLTVTLKDLSDTIFVATDVDFDVCHLCGLELQTYTLLKQISFWNYRKDHSLAPPAALDCVGTPSPISLPSVFFV